MKACIPLLPTIAEAVEILKLPPPVFTADQEDRFPLSKPSEKIGTSSSVVCCRIDPELVSRLPDARTGITFPANMANTRLSTRILMLFICNLQ
jgi:hypothetical protein